MNNNNNITNILHSNYMPNITRNTTMNLLSYSYDGYTSSQIFSLIAFSIILLLGSIGNLLVIYVYGFTCRRRFVKFERLMLMLGIVDFIASVTNPMYYIYRIANRGVWGIGGFSCKVIPALGPIFTGISLGVILIMAVDRDRAVSTPFKRQFHLNTIYKAVFLTIVSSVLVTVPYMYHNRLNVNNDGTTNCIVDGDFAYDVMIIVIFMLSDVIFVVIFVMTTVRVFMKLGTKSSSSKGARVQKVRAREINRILKIILAMGIMFVVCVFPRDLLFIAFSLRRVFPPQIPYDEVIEVNITLKVLHTANSCVNVFLYSFLNEKFRAEVFRVLMKGKRLRSSLHSSQYTTRIVTEATPIDIDRERLTSKKCPLVELEKEILISEKNMTAT